MAAGGLEGEKVLSTNLTNFSEGGEGAGAGRKCVASLAHAAREEGAQGGNEKHRISVTGISGQGLPMTDSTGIDRKSGESKPNIKETGRTWHATHDKKACEWGSSRRTVVKEKTERGNPGVRTQNKARPPSYLRG